MSAFFARVLLVEDEPADVRLIQELLREAPQVAVEVVAVDRLSAAQAALGGGEPFDAILLDLNLPDSRGVETVQRVVTLAPGVPIVVLSGLEDEAAIAQAVEEGAQDYLIKGHLTPPLIAHAIRFAIERQRILNEKYVRLSELARSVSLQRLASLESKIERLVELVAEGRSRSEG
ncbi:MAG: hypothetical protein KatS3mg115_0149 [Candidatus Poribacteria bacterium]|nr:MAG: hypothetical protein KatS3mg115_0149 [Candidatus Poribacteria bacterium]